MAEMKLTKENFVEVITKSEIPILVDFWATWCGPCQMMGPVLADVAQELEGKLIVGKVNVDEEMLLAQKMKIESIPTMVLFEDGKPVKTTIGYQSKEELYAWLGI